MSKGRETGSGGGWSLPFFRKRAAFYYDGFNLYHAVDAYKRPYLKWLNLNALGRAIAPKSEVVKRVVWCSAFSPTNRSKLQRHENYRKALEGQGVICRMGHFIHSLDSCNSCGHKWQISVEKQIPLLIDSRFRLSEFPNATTATPNQDEVEQILGKNFNDEDCQNLCKRLGFESLLVTCGNKGMLLVEKDRKPVQIEAIGSKEPVDVTGAGDTVIAVYALALASGLSFAESANLANHAGGIVVMKKGTASVNGEELIASLGKHKLTEHKTQTI